MWGQPSVRDQRFQLARSRSVARFVPILRRRPGRQLIPNIRLFVRFICVAFFIGWLCAPGTSKAQDLADSIFAINNELLTDTRVTSGLLVAGPPEVAREISIVDSAMFDAANAAGGSPYSPIAYSGGPVP